ncbi:uncharacterized protein VTP21DRAFT_1734 [Calcarisporiella thermophila]|uniref:uncharacterized protein n=1 Tax=Calcarisporiella thermophila TaxID=911321 RepID=UPI0037426547
MTVSKELTPYSLLESITLHDLDKDESFNATNLWQDKPTVVLVVRRPGCLFCREQAILLRQHRDFLEQRMGFRVLAVVHEQLGAHEFNEYWNGELYWDKDKGFYAALGGGKPRVASMSNFLKLGMWTSMYRSLVKSGVNGNLQGDGFHYGGLYVLRQGSGGPVYEYREQSFGDLVPLSELFTACATIANIAEEDRLTLNKIVSEQQQLEKNQHAGGIITSGTMDKAVKCDQDACFK